MKIVIQDKGIWLDVYVDEVFSARIEVVSFISWKLLYSNNTLHDLVLQGFFNVMMNKRKETIS